MSKFAVKSAFLFVISLFIFSLATRNVLAAEVDVTPATPNGWVLQSANGGVGSYVSTQSHIGSGSMNMLTVGGGNEQVSLKRAYSGVDLDDLTRLEHWSLAKAQTLGTNNHAVVYIDVMSTGGGADTLIFDPNAQPGGSTFDAWELQDGNATDAVWTTNLKTTPGNLQQYITFVTNVYGPGISITELRFQVGPTPNNFNAFVDDFTIGINGSNTTYDFEPTTASNNYTQTFYSDNNFTNPVGTSTTIPSPIKYNWGLGSPAGVPVDNFSAKWEGTYDFVAGKYNFVGSTDNKLKVTIDGTDVVVNKTSKGVANGARLMTAGVHSVKVEYVHADRAASVAFRMYSVPSNAFPFAGSCFDLNGDGVVNPGDQAYQASMVGVTGAVNTIAADLNNDGVVNPGDQGILANKVGKTCPY